MFKLTLEYSHILISLVNAACCGFFFLLYLKITLRMYCHLPGNEQCVNRPILYTSEHKQTLIKKKKTGHFVHIPSSSVDGESRYK